MSELNEAIHEEVQDAQVMTVNIDETLTVSGQAADAYAVGQELAKKADKSELQTKISVNGQEADAQGLILLKAGHIPMSEEPDAEDVGAAVRRIDRKTAEDIPVSEEEGAETIAEALAGMTGQYADTLPMSEDDPTTAAEKMAEMDRAMVKAIQTAGGRILPDGTGTAQIDEVEYAQQIRSSRNIETREEFIIRTTSGGGSVSDGDGTLAVVRGVMRHSGWVDEILNLLVIPIERPTPAAITAELDTAVFTAYVQTAGTYNLNYTTGWSADPALYGVTVSGTPLAGDRISIAWDGENAPVMTVTAPREPEAEITAEMDKSVARAYMQTGGTVDIYYTTGWSEDPALYGITVTGVPIAGDRLRITYVKWDRGTITPATPTALKATGWNLYDSTAGRARCTRYSDTYGYRIGGSYVSVEYAATVDGERTALAVSGGLFNVPGDGWLFVNGGSSDTFIYTTWSDWISSVPEFEPYSESGVDLSGVMALYFPNGLLAVGNARDEIDLNTQTAISRIQRITYSDEAYAAAQASGLAFDADRNYIYIERENPASYAISVEAGYQVSEHGIEFVEGTAVPVYVAAMYGPNLRDKLERDVVTYSAQEMGASDQAQARANIGAAAAADLEAVQDGIAILANGNTHAAVAAGRFVYVRNHATLAQGLYKATEAIATDGELTASNLTADPDGGLNDLQGQVDALNSKLTTKTANFLEIGSDYSSSISVVSIRCIRRNDGLCLVEGTFTVSTAIQSSARKALFTGMPEVQNSMQWCTVTNITEGKTYRLAIGTTTLDEFYTTYPAGEYIISPFVYYS